MIPDAAVEAGAKRAWLDSALGRRTCDAWEALTEIEQTLRRDDARRILEAAAPHMLAEVWGEGHESGFWNGRMTHGDVTGCLIGIDHANAHNPYASKP